MQTLVYSEIPRRLQPYVGTIYSGIAEPGPTVLPALMAQLWVCTFPVYWVAPGTAVAQRLPPVVLMGPVNGSNTVIVHEPGRIVGIGFWPRGWSEIVRVAASELANDAVDATAVWPRLCGDLLEQVATARSWHSMSAALVQFLDAVLMTSVPSIHPRVIGAIDTWLSKDASAGGTIGDLADSLALSTRQLQRITARTHGGSPVLLRSKQRALRAAARAASPAHGHLPPWEEYADQSHFIREFRRWIGVTPTVFANEPGIGHSVFSKSWRGDSDHPLAPRREEDDSVPAE